MSKKIARQISDIKRELHTLSHGHKGKKPSLVEQAQMAIMVKEKGRQLHRR